VTRSLEPWVAKHDDQAIPDRVKIRVLKSQANADGIPICPCCTMPVRPSDAVDFDHETPLADGGKHAEVNLRAIHRKCHKLKTAREAQTRAEERSQFKAIYGLKERKAWPSRPFASANPRHTATTPPTKVFRRTYALAQEDDLDV